MKKALIITGPTATGKTSLALQIAKVIHGALISVDSIQVYKECDIISGKDIPHDATYAKKIFPGVPKNFDMGKWIIDGIPLYLTDVVDVTYDFSVADFQLLAKAVGEKIEKEGMVPIFVGGTTLYIKSLLTPIETADIPPDPLLREKLLDATVEELQAILAKYDRKKLAAMNESDIQNPRRHIRAIEIARSDKEKKSSHSMRFDFKTIGLRLHRDDLRKRIDKRVSQRLNDGAIEEAKKIFRNYENLSGNVKNANGYRQLFEHFTGKATEAEAIEKWRHSEYLHAKNQMTFFNKMTDIEWYDTDSSGHSARVLSQVQKWLSTPKTT